MNKQGIAAQVRNTHRSSYHLVTHTSQHAALLLAEAALSCIDARGHKEWLDQRYLECDTGVIFDNV